VCPHCGWVEGTLPEQAYHLHPGVTLSGRYIIGTVTGFGGFGTIYKAWDSQLGTIVAIKEFYPAGLVSRVPGTKEIVVFSGERKDNYIQSKKRFLSEARNLAMFNKNPNIVNVFNFFEENNTAYIVMEYLDGVSLRDYLPRHGDKLPVEESLEIVHHVMDALIDIHSKGIVHRDIHPGNIFITADDSVKLLDFGAARLSTGDDEATLTVVVTQGYASTEQYRSKSKQGPYTDIYGLGATLYRMITGILPEEAVDRQVKDNLKRPSELGIEIGENLDRAIMKAMALKAEIRFQKVSEFKDAVFNNSKIDYPEIEFVKRRKRRVILVSGIISALAALIIIIGWYYTTYSQPATLPDVTVEADTIVVWIPIDDKSAVGEPQIAAWQRIVEGFYNDNEQIEVDYKMILASEYAEKLETVSSADEPTMYCIDGLEDLRPGSRASLELLYNSLNPNDFLFVENINTFFPSGNIMPLGFKAYTLYGNNEAARLKGIAIPETITDLDGLFGDGNSVRVERKDVPGFLLLYGAEADESGAYSAGEGLADGLIALKRSYEAQNAKPDELPLDLMSEDRLLYLFADTSDIRNVQNALPGYYSVVSIQNGESLAGVFSDMWVVSATATENQQNAAMKFIAYLLNDRSQDEFYLQQDSSAPINKAIFQEFIHLNPDFEYLSDKTGNIKFAGEFMPQLRVFGDDVYGKILNQEINDEQIRAFLEDYGEAAA